MLWPLVHLLMLKKKMFYQVKTKENFNPQIVAKMFGYEKDYIQFH